MITFSNLTHGRKAGSITKTGVYFLYVTTQSGMYSHPFPSVSTTCCFGVGLNYKNENLLFFHQKREMIVIDI